MLSFFFFKFALNFGQNSSDCMARLGVNTTEHASEMELYIILTTLKNSEDTFNNEMPLFQAKPVQCSPAMVGFSTDKINILQHIKCLFSATALVPRALDGMNIVIMVLEI